MHDARSLTLIYACMYDAYIHDADGILSGTDKAILGVGFRPLFMFEPP